MKNRRLLTAAFLTTLLTACAVVQDRETTGQYLDDAGITASIKSSLIAEPTLKATEIHVDTFKNTVQLSGFVSTYDQVRTAERIARNTSGVRKIENNIKIRR
ncbi:MAG: hypothetical protein BGO77_01860 [Caedibacter sp. 37-49]|nr:MAG: hypothetical protein BGO77_01860 [Caedibacter sp. 37-49]